MTLSFTLEDLLPIALAAHEVILPFWRSDLEVERKGDDSPVTQADKAANRLIEAELLRLAPDIPVISEEGSHAALPENATFWLVDPVDGTKSFIRGQNEFTVNIALIQRKRPVMAVLTLPAQDVLYKAEIGKGAWRKRGDDDWELISVSSITPETPRKLVSSRSHRSPKLDSWLAEKGIPVAERVQANSALKFGLVAEGSADLYTRIGPTMEWDTAAGHCLVEAAGGSLTDLNGEPFLYGKQGYLNGGFITSGKVG